MKFFKKRKEILRDDNSVYLIRWNLFECKYFSIKIHKILLSDHDCMHDHPWSFVSIILWGGYVEHREIGEILPHHVNHNPCEIQFESVSKIMHPFSILYRKATDIHRLEIHQPAITLVITFKKIREWGFWTKLGWIEWFKYNSNQKCD